jgi:hypothetical protein
MQTRRFLAVLGATLIAAALPARPAFAQRQSDQGEYQILQARYGTATRNIDVTDRLEQLARHDRPIQITNDLFGEDPAPGQVKALRIYARGREGATRVFEYREEDFIDGSQFSGWSGGRWGQGGGWRGGWGGDVAGPQGGLTIVTARYGDGRRSREVTDRVRSMVRNGRLDIPVENDTFGVDPAPGSDKALVVVYSVNGVRQEVRVPERGRLSLP